MRVLAGGRIVVAEHAPQAVDVSFGKYMGVDVNAHNEASRSVTVNLDFC